jgi:uncharacterized protein (DUF2141 family)
MLMGFLHMYFIRRILPMNLKKNALRFLGCSLVILSLNYANAADLQVKVTNVANASGNVIATLCDKDTFLKHCTQAELEKAMAGSVTLTFKNVAPGKYAISAFHDENANRKLDRDGSGIPQEGTGFSRNARGHFGPPKFDDASFDVKEGANEVIITLSY